MSAISKRAGNLTKISSSARTEMATGMARMINVVMREEEKRKKQV